MSRATSPEITPATANYDARIGGDSTAVFRSSPLPVGSFPANSVGLHDMNGNVWEWTEDDYCSYPNVPMRDPVARCGSGIKNIRGGSWAFSRRAAGCGHRYTHAPVDRGYSIGFRLVRDR